MHPPRRRTFVWPTHVFRAVQTLAEQPVAQALIVLAGAKVGDEVLIYHSNDGKAIVGLAKVTRKAYPDPKLADPKRLVIEIAPVKALKSPVTLAEIKAVPGLADLALVRQSRLSCMSVSREHRSLLRGLGVR